VKTRLLFATIFILVVSSVMPQAVYDNFEDNKLVYYSTLKGAVLDSVAPNPARDSLNSSAGCARYTRSRQRYDNIHMVLKGNLIGIPEYASYDALKKFRLKVYTNAPVGTMVEIQMATSKSYVYPDAVHSQYQAVTRSTGKWEVLEFTFAVSPRGSKTTMDQVDALNLMFSPATHSSYVFYFDDLEGPTIVPQKAHRFSLKKRR
jgi:hypothetical protein